MYDNLNARNSVKTVVQKIMGKLLGSRVVSKQEIYQLINNMGMVNCSHNFVNINLASNASCIELAVTAQSFFKHIFRK